MTAPHPMASSDEGEIPHLPPTPESESLKEVLADGRRAYELWKEAAYAALRVLGYKAIVGKRTRSPRGMGWRP